MRTRQVILLSSVVTLGSMNASLAGEALVLTDAQLEQVSAGATAGFSTDDFAVSTTVEAASSNKTFNVSSTSAFALSPGGAPEANTSGASGPGSVATTGNATSTGGTQNDAFSGTTVVQVSDQNFIASSSIGFGSAGDGGTSSASSGGAADSTAADIEVVVEPPITAAAFSSGEDDVVSYAGSASTGVAQMTSTGFAESADAATALAAQ